MTIEVNLTAELFRRFTLFDTFTRRKMWRSPVIFASILTVCGCICFFMRHVDGAVLLGCVLLFVGLGVIYNLDKKAMAQMTEDLEARKAK